MTPVQGEANRESIAVTFRNVISADRALTVYFVERFDPRNPVWWNDIRSRVPAGVADEYANLTTVDVGANSNISLYPFACATGDGIGRVIGVPPWLGPRVVRFVLDTRAHLLYAAFDLALTPAGDRTHHDSAQLAVVRYDVDPAWGFRDAAAKYYTMFPGAFARRTGDGGIWSPFESPEDVHGASDFHFAFHEGDNSVAGDRANGILSFRYVEPMTYWMSMPAGMPRDYSHAVDLVRNQASIPGQTADQINRQAQAVLYSGTSDAHGDWNVSFRNTPWCNGAVWILNPNPALPHPSGAWTKALLNEAAEPAQGRIDQPDGEYLDSLEANADVLDYAPASLAAASVPLTFTADDYRPTLPTWFSVYEAASQLSGSLHHRGKLLMANTTPWRFNVFDPLLDVLGTEMTCFDDNGAYAPESDSIMNLRRTLACHKPYLLLLDTDFSKVSEVGIEQYMQRSMFYGFFPSMFSADAATSAYWQNPALYNRDRPLFRLYIPVIQRLDTAGWEPVTQARTSNSGVWIERYGKRDFTVLNSTDSAVNCIVTIDFRRLFPALAPSKASWKAEDLVSGRPLATVNGGICLRRPSTAVNCHSDAGEISIPLQLKPSETRAIEISSGA